MQKKSEEPKEMIHTIENECNNILNFVYDCYRSKKHYYKAWKSNEWDHTKCKKKLIIKIKEKEN